MSAAYANTGADPLVTELSAAATRCAALWAAHRVEMRRTRPRRVRHPEFGELEFDCQVPHIVDTDQRTIACYPEPGSPTASGFARLTELTTAR
ncbi:hypothetical protein [Nocardia sp. NPDC057227]|uniref:MmyB family transcriptional regulator n=1 Tax=Nocardia sp. NPDC057227 TaxID=3346056 RepID=UPI00363A86BF